MYERLALAGDEEAPLETKAPGNFGAEAARRVRHAHGGKRGCSEAWAKCFPFD